MPSDKERTNSGAVRSESPLTWLRRRKDKHGARLIGEEQFLAGERLGRDFKFAQMTNRTTMSWSGIPAGGAAYQALEPGEKSLDASERVRRALRAVGPDFAGILLDVCCHEIGLEQLERRAGWPERSGKIVVHYALCALARHYGYLPSESVPADRPFPAIRHWGTADYRPTLDGDL